MRNMNAHGKFPLGRYVLVLEPNDPRYALKISNVPIAWYAPVKVAARPEASTAPSAPVYVATVPSHPIPDCTLPLVSPRLLRDFF